MTDPGTVPGVVLGAPVANRERTWHATSLDGASREVVVLALSPDPEVRGAAIAALEPLRGRGLGHRQLVLDVTAARAGVALIAEPVSAAYLTSMRRLNAGQLVTLGAPLAQELAELHRRGLAFGATDLRAEVVIDVVGRPVLTVERWAARRVRDEVPGPRADLAALVALLRHAAAPDSSRRGQRVLAALGAADCAALALALRRATSPQALPVPSARRAQRARGRGAPLQHRRARSVRARAGRVFGDDRIRAARGPVGLAAAVAVVAVVGWASVRSTSAGASADPAPTVGNPFASTPAVAPTTTPAAPAATDWRAVLSTLDRARADVFAGTGELDDADALGSAAYVSDAERSKELQRKGLRAQGLSPQLLSVRPVAQTANRVQLVVSDVLPPYRLVDAAGRTQATVAGRGRADWTITLVRRTTGDAGAPVWGFATVARR